MTFLAAPNPFKGTLSAPLVAAAMARGVKRARPGARVRRRAMADGGEGTLEALVSCLHGRYVACEVRNPLGETVRARFGLVAETLAVVEMAQACGVATLARERWDPAVASSFGLGQLLEAARLAGARRILVAVGGSITNDGGAGMAQALGVRLAAADGRDLPPGGLALGHLARIESGSLSPAWKEVEVEVAVDVLNPLTGPRGASLQFSAQKGAGPRLQAQLEAAMIHYQSVIGEEVGALAGAGAAGGVGAGLVRFLGARLTPGAALVADTVALDRAISGCELVITGEGRLDVQTLEGKGPLEVARRAVRQGVPVLMVAGSIGPGGEQILKDSVERIVTLDQAPAFTARTTARAIEEAVCRALS